MTTTNQHLRSAAVQLSIASSAIISARRHLTEADYGDESRWLSLLAVSLFDTAHDIEQAIPTQENQ